MTIPKTQQHTRRRSGAYGTLQSMDIEPRSNYHDKEFTLSALNLQRQRESNCDHRTYIENLTRMARKGREQLKQKRQKEEEHMHWRRPSRKDKKKNEPEGRRQELHPDRDKIHRRIYSDMHNHRIATVRKLNDTARRIRDKHGIDHS